MGFNMIASGFDIKRVQFSMFGFQLNNVKFYL